MGHLKIKTKKKGQIFYLYNLFIGFIHLEFLLPYILQVIVNTHPIDPLYIHACSNCNYVKISINYKKEPSFSILPKLQLFLLFSGHSFFLQLLFACLQSMLGYKVQFYKDVAYH